MTFFNRILSYLIAIPVYRFTSSRGTPMDIRWENGKLCLNSSTANYSFNALHRVFRRALHHAELNLCDTATILNLGMGAGSTIHILREELNIDAAIVSVENDAEIIRVAEEYFHIENYAHHKVVHADAYSFVLEETRRFELILVDLFIEKVVGQEFLSNTFIKKLEQLLQPNAQLIFNYIGADASLLTRHLSGSCKRVLEIGENKVLVYQKTDKS